MKRLTIWRLIISSINRNVGKSIGKVIVGALLTFAILFCWIMSIGTQAGLKQINSRFGADILVLSKDSKLEASNLFLNVVSSHEYLDELKPEYQKAADIEDNTIRSSIGLEDPQDLIEDLQQALEKAFE